MSETIRKAIAFNRCFICGGQLKGGIIYPFTVDAVEIVRRTTRQPPSHRDCARDAANGTGKTALVFCNSYEITQDIHGMVFKFSKPFKIEWIDDKAAA